jgi:hypothetical protein
MEGPRNATGLLSSREIGDSSTHQETLASACQLVSTALASPDDLSARSG